MGISILSRRFATTEALQDHTQNRIGRALKHFESGDISITMEKSAPNQFTVRASTKGKTPPMHARASSRDMYTAVARAAAKLQRQLDSAKGRSLAKIHDALDSNTQVDEDDQ